MKYSVEHSIKIPSVDKRISFREYSVGEEKFLVLIDQEDSENKKFSKIKKLVKQCLITDIDFEKISPAEILFIFVNMRIHSVGGDSVASFPCPKCFLEIDELIRRTNELELSKENLPTDKLFEINKEISKLNAKISDDYSKIKSDVAIKLAEVKVIENKDHNKILTLSDKLKVEMKYGINDIDYLEADINYDGLTDEEIIIAEDETAINILARCIDTIWEDDQALTGLSIQEKVKIIKEFPARFRKVLDSFLLTQPIIEYKDKATCGVCKNEFEVVINNVNDFF
jgi:hypothetical protein